MSFRVKVVPTEGEGKRMVGDRMAEMKEEKEEEENKKWIQKENKGERGRRE